jgi:hypothetical protein
MDFGAMTGELNDLKNTIANYEKTDAENEAQRSLEARENYLIKQVTGGVPGRFDSGLSKGPHSEIAQARDLVENAFPQLTEKAGSEQILGTFGAILRRLYRNVPLDDILLPLRHVQAGIEKQKTNRHITPKEMTESLERLRAGLQKFLRDVLATNGDKFDEISSVLGPNFLSYLHEYMGGSGHDKWVTTKHARIR